MDKKYCIQIDCHLLLRKSMLAFLAVLLLHGCGLQRIVVPPPEPQVPDIPSRQDTQDIEPSRQGPANALYGQAKSAMSQGDNHKAELTLERAIRIEPGNPFYWYTMGKIKYRQGAYDEAVQFCLKSKSLAGRNLRLLKLNDQLIKEAKKDAG